jgi:hypothetical protein
MLTLEAEILDPLGKDCLRLSCTAAVYGEQDALNAGDILAETFQENSDAARLLARSLAGEKQ